MSKATSRKVARQIERLQYVPIISGMNLKHSRAMSIGMIIIDQSPYYLSDGVTTNIVSGVTNYLNSQGYTLQLEGLRLEDFPDSALMKYRRTDGICIMLSGGREDRRSTFERIQKTNQPLVLFLEPAPVGDGQVCCILQEDRQAGYVLAKHLLERGARDILFLSHSLTKWWGMDERIKGARRAAQEVGEFARIDVATCGGGDFASVQGAVRNYLSHHSVPHAIMGGNDQIGLAVMRCLADMGIRVPQRVMVTGFHAFELWKYANWTLTTVRSPSYELGQIGGQEIVRCIETGSFSSSMIRRAYEFIRGEST